MKIRFLMERDMCNRKMMTESVNQNTETLSLQPLVAKLPLDPVKGGPKQ